MATFVASNGDRNPQREEQREFKAVVALGEVRGSSSSSSSSSGGIRLARSGPVPTVEPELKDLETSLLALEKLDRASPDLWPDQIPGVTQFIPLDTPYESPQVNVLQGLTPEDLTAIHQLGSLPVFSILEEVKRLQNIAYQLGLEETKEMTRGKYLNILHKRR